MSDDFSKLWIQQNLNQNAIRRASEAIQRTGRALPCKVTAVSGSIVTVEFEVDSTPWTLPQITIPKAESPYFRMPTQIGDLGITIPCDVYLGGISGLGGGTANMNPAANLSALMFMPVSNKNSPPIDPNAAQIEGPNGVIAQTSDGANSVKVSSAGVALTGSGGTPKGIVQGDCLCAFTGQPHAMISITVKGTK